MSEHLYDICEKHCVSSSCLNITVDSERVDKGEKQVGINSEQEVMFYKQVSGGARADN